MGRTKLLVVLILVCAIKCLGMSQNELEDFADYLEKTSQLSPTLKKGVEPEYYDDDEIVSDHAWEESGKFEGDLILNEGQRKLIVANVAEGLSRNGIQDSTKRWPNNEVIVYIQVEHFSADQVQAILSGIDDLARASCVKFRRYRKGDPDAVVVQGSRRGCFSQVGYQGGYQVLNLSARHPVGRGCFRHGTVVHEFLHTLGFYHMQSSPDRDDYVDIVWDNIQKRARHNFRKYNSFSVSDFGVGYDYESVLHYSRRAFSLNGRDTIVPKKSGAEIGQRLGLSDKDTQKLNKMYCDADSDLMEADETPTNKNKKKSIKNKPFDGHGLGYHQGKAVVFKVLPDAETYKISDVPSSYPFDYFSKAPQILSTSENKGFRANKEIAQAYQHPELLSKPEYKESVDYNAKPESYYHEKTNENQDHLPHKEAVVMNSNFASMKNPSEIEKHADTEMLTHDEKHDPALIEAFDRLTKIIKSHVYPSQTPDLSIYKMFEEHAEHGSNQKLKEEPHGSFGITSIRYPIPGKENLYDSNSYQMYKGFENHPKTISTSYYDGGRKDDNRKEKSKLTIPKPEEETYIDTSYTMLHRDNQNEHAVAPYASHEQYRGEEDECSKQSSKICNEKTKHENYDEWHKLPYDYNPKYDSDTYMKDTSDEDHYDDETNYRPRGQPGGAGEHSYREPVHYGKYNDVSYNSY